MRQPVLGAVAALLLTACASAGRGPEPASLRAEVDSTERAFAGTMAERDHRAFTTFLSADAVFFDGETPTRGREAVAARWRPFFEPARAPFSWEPDRVEVLASGDLALSTGPVRDPNGNVVGRFNSIWRREAPGRWRIVFDKGSPVCPQPTAASTAAQPPAAPAGPSPAIRVVLLGTGRPDPAIDRFGPATLVQAGGRNLLFDAGRGASQRLWQLRVPLGQVHALFLTHLHSDHTVGIPDLWLTGWLPTPFGRREAPLEVWGPEGTSEMMAGLRSAYRWDVRVRGDGEHLPPAGIEVVAHDLDEGVVYDRDGVKVSAFLVDHGGLLRPAYGYRVEYGGHSVVVSGDTGPNENLVRHAAGADVLVHEVAAVRTELLERSATAPTARRILSFHTSPEDAGRIFSRVGPKLAVLTHFVLLTTDPAFAPPTGTDVLRRARTTYGGPLVLGEDMMSIEVGDEVKVSPPERAPE